MRAMSAEGKCSDRLADKLLPDWLPVLRQSSIIVAQHDNGCGPNRIPDKPGFTTSAETALLYNFGVVHGGTKRPYGSFVSFGLGQSLFFMDVDGNAEWRCP
jgi:hypothetical protein